MSSCRWVVRPDNQGRLYCNAPTSYSMVDDGGEKGAAKVRKYNPFCDFHMIEAVKQSKESLDEAS